MFLIGIVIVHASELFLQFLSSNDILQKGITIHTEMTKFLLIINILRATTISHHNLLAKM